MAKKPDSAKNESFCPNCGMPTEQPQAYKLGSQTYCCQGCAEQTGCTCSEDTRATA